MAIAKRLIAPCGMDCALCIAHLRKNNPCQGCRQAEQNKPKTRIKCQLRTCPKRKGKYCFKCAEFPCDRLKHLDKRYRTFYRMSMLANLETIQQKGIKEFLKAEKKKWQCKKCAGLICCHNGLCINCQQKKIKNKKQKFRWVVQKAQP